MGPVSKAAAALRWLAGHACRRLVSRWGGDGILLAASAALLLISIFVWTASERLVERKRHTLMLHLGSPAASVPPSRDHPDGNAQRLEAFKAALLTRDSLPDGLDSLLALGPEASVVVARADFHPEADLAGGFHRYRMSMPVSGSGPSIGRFMREALQRHPALLFEAVQFERDSVGTAAVRANIRWAFLMTSATTSPSRLSPPPGPGTLAARRISPGETGR